MKNPLGLLAGALLAALSVAAAPAQPDWWEPSYNGKTVSEWLDEYGVGPGAYKPNPQADDALRHIGPNAVPDLLQLLYATNPNPAAQTPASWDHWKAYLGFLALGPAGKLAIPDLVILANSSDATRSFFPNTIQEMKDIATVARWANNSTTYVARGGRPRSRSTSPFLVDGDIAAWSLAAMGADGVPPLVKMLANSNPLLKVRAIEALGKAGPAAEPAVPALVKTLHDTNLDVRVAAADALGCIGMQPDLAIPALTDALADPEISVDQVAAISLGNFRQRATNAIPALLAAFLGPRTDEGAKSMAAVALSKISRDITAKQVIPVLLRDFKVPPRSGFANMSLISLGEMLDEADLVVPVLIESAGDTNLGSLDRQNAANSLGHFGPAAKAAVPTLSRLTNDPDALVRAKAVRALNQIDPSSPPSK